MIVFDSSIYASIIVGDEFYEKCLRAFRTYLSKGIATLDLAYAEITNTLWKHILLLRRIPREEAKYRTKIIRQLLSKTSTIYTCEELLEETIEIAIHHNITIYDALYLSLAKKLNTKLVTTDKALYQKLKNTPMEGLISLIK